MKKKHSNKKKGGKGNLIFSAVVLILFLIFLMGIAIWERGGMKMPEPSHTQTEQTVPPQDTEPGQTEPEQTEPATAATTVPAETTLPLMDTGRINFLLVGRDAHGEGENGRSDSMILCSVDTGDNTITLISFLRDMYVPIPGYRENRLNAAYSMGGSELLIETLEQNFGVNIDVSLEIDFEGFVGLIDKLGGVDIELTAKEANHLGHGLTAGVNHLDGELALAYSRIRYLDSDFVRTERQRNVLAALLEKYHSASLNTILDVADAFLDESTSDHTDDVLLSYALEMYLGLNDAELITHRVPADGTWTYETILGMSVIDVDFEENRELLQELLD